jgi:hypothetical protein
MTPLRLDAAGSSRDRRTLSDFTLPSEPEATMQAKHLEASVRWRLWDTLSGFWLLGSGSGSSADSSCGSVAQPVTDGRLVSRIGSRIPCRPCDGRYRAYLEGGQEARV